MYRCISIGVGLLWGLTTFGANLYVAPTGSATGDGSAAQPLSLAAALTNGVARPGDMVWLRGGTYRGAFLSTLKGQSGLPITVRQYPGERATIDGSLTQNQGGWVNYWGFEVLNSYANRYSSQAGSSPTDLPLHDGIDCTVPNVKFINLAVHDAIGNGLGLWLLAPDNEVYGCLIYYNGWQGTDRAHGHGYYGQNVSGVKQFTDNLVFSQYGNGVQLYGSDSSYLYNFQLTGNTFFNNGIIALNNSGGNNVTLEGGAPAKGIVFNNNATYHVIKAAGSVSAGSPTQGNADLQMMNNYLVGRLLLQNWNSITFSGNFVAARIPVAQLVEDVQSYVASNHHWDNNYYLSDILWYPFKFQTTSGASSPQYFFPDWQRLTGLDAHSTYSYGVWSGTKIIVRPNQYEPGRAHVTVYNWGWLPSVKADLSSVLTVGTAFEVRNAQNFFGAPVVSGVYDGNPVTLPMLGLTAADPIGQGIAPAPTGPEFNAFVVVSLGTAPVPPAPGPGSGSGSGGFGNPTALSIPSTGTATPYPSTATVSGLSGLTTKVTVTVAGLSHTWPDDLGLLLVNPTGQSVLLMSAAGGGKDAANLTLTFDDASSNVLPDSGTLVSGTYRPGHYGTSKAFPAPAPAAAYASSLAGFNGFDPNGVWSLYVVDFASGDSGRIAGGWSLSIDTGSVAISNISNPSSVIIPSVGPALMYPDVIPVANVSGQIVKATVSIRGLGHTWPSDVGFLLVGPGGQGAELMAHAGGSSPVSNLTMTFDDSAADALPSAASLLSGTFRPSVYSGGAKYPLPAPSSGYGTALSAFNGTSPNGNWSLYVVDGAAGDTGAIVSGWTISFLTATSGLNSYAGSAGTPILGRLASTSEPTTPRIRLYSQPAVANGWFNLFVKSAPTVPTVIDVSSNLVDWVPLYTNDVDLPAAVVSDPSVSGNAIRFYRARALQVTAPASSTTAAKVKN